MIPKQRSLIFSLDMDQIVHKQITVFHELALDSQIKLMRHGTNYQKTLKQMTLLNIDLLVNQTNTAQTV